MATSIRESCALVSLAFALLLAPINATASPQVLSEEAWRADILEMVATVKANHPNAYLHTSEEDFDTAVEVLLSRLGDFDDKEIIVEMAKIIALVEDGHTRLSFPRQHNELGFSFSHSKPKEPTDAALNFTSLPFRFSVLEGKLYIIEASEAYRHLLGAEVTAFGQTPSEDALKRLSSVNYNDNEMTDILLAGDRASLPDLLHALKITTSAEEIPLTLRKYDNGEAVEIIVSPLGDEPSALVAPEASATPLWLIDKASPKWAKLLRKERAHFIQLNQIEGGMPDVMLADFMREEINKAKKARAQKIIIDLRHNHGGSGGYSRSVVNAIAASPYNEYGKFLILIGRETFSAAGHLLTELEQYTDALFFGEPSGAAPDSYGDPKRIQLKNSGLDLRVSRLHWCAWRAFETRTATAPHYPVAYTIDDYMTGRDPVLEAALTYKAPKGLAALIADVSAATDHWDGAIILFSRFGTDPRILDRDLSKFAGEIIAEAQTLEAAGRDLPALFLYDIARRLDDARAEAYLGWARTALALGEQGEAENAVKAGLDALPDNEALLDLQATLAQ